MTQKKENDKSIPGITRNAVNWSEISMHVRVRDNPEVHMAQDNSSLKA